MIRQLNLKGKHILLPSSILVALEMSKQYKGCTYTAAKQTGMFTFLQAGFMLDHVMSWLVDCHWSELNIFSKLKVLSSSRWQANYPRTTSCNLWYLWSRLTTHLKMHMSAMHLLCTSCSCFIMIFELAYDPIWSNNFFTKEGNISELILVNNSFFCKINWVFRLSLQGLLRDDIPSYWPHFLGLVSIYKSRW